jgi:RNA 2',3'-cyclic 3'-phosphodiesterase
VQSRIPCGCGERGYCRRGIEKTGVAVETRNMELKRLFVCVVPPPARLDGVVRLQKSLSAISCLRLVPRENLHITLLFLGRVRGDTVPAIINGLETVCRSVGTIRLGLTEVGCFPNRHRPRVISIGVSDSTSALKQLAHDVREAVVAVGYPVEDTRFRPHLTLARVRRTVSRSQFATAFDACAVAAERDESLHEPFSTGELILMHSSLDSHGATYTALHTVRFRG